MLNNDAEADRTALNHCSQGPTPRGRGGAMTVIALTTTNSSSRRHLHRLWIHEHFWLLATVIITLIMWVNLYGFS